MKSLWIRKACGHLSVMRQNLGEVVSNRAHSASEIGQRITELREARGLSRKELAQAIGLSSESSISEIENGRNSKKYQQLADMAAVLGTTPNHLLGFEAMPSVDQLDMMGATIQKILIDAGWERARAEALVDIATEVAIEKSEFDLDQRLAAAFRRHALKL